MAGEVDKVIVLDLEATCWERSPPAGEEVEIIEIGVCLLGVPTGARERLPGVLVRPTNSRVSELCTRLTTLTQKDVDRGVDFATACAGLAKQGRDRTWATYGDFDRLLLERQCQERGVPFPLGRTHLNVKNLLALRRGLPLEVGLDRGMAELGLPLEGAGQRAADSASDVARLLWELIRWR